MVLGVFLRKTTLFQLHRQCYGVYKRRFQYGLEFRNKQNTTCDFFNDLIIHCTEFPKPQDIVCLAERLLIRAAEKSDSPFACSWLAKESQAPLNMERICKIAVPCWVQAMSIFGYRCPVLCTLGSFWKKDIKHILLILFRYLLIWTYLWMIYLRPLICFKQIHKEM